MEVFAGEQTIETPSAIPVTVIYHDNCADGFTSAWVYYLARCESLEQLEAEQGESPDLPESTYIPAQYGDALPDVTGQIVFILDFSYSRDDTLELLKQAKHLYIFDHHKSAIEKIADLSAPNLTMILDVTRSGAGITWDYFFKDQPRPLLVQTVEDRDLWQFKHKYTRAIMANIFSYEYSFETWNQINDLLAVPSLQQSFISSGEALERKHFKDIKEFLKNNTYWLNIRVPDKDSGDCIDYKVPCANMPYFQASDVGHILGEGHPFAACFWYIVKDNKIQIQFSLRSRPEGADVSKIAQAYGGGGHKNAVGFVISEEIFKEEDMLWLTTID